MTNEIKITTGSRLHAGFYYAGSEWSINWGSAGFYIDKPSFEAYFSIDKKQFEGPNYIKQIIDKVASLLNIRDYSVRVSSYIPEHIGLGSTTQITLATITCFKMLYGLNINSNEIIDKLGINKYSGVGSLLFNKGGFIADSGVPDKHGPRELISLRIPEKWKFVWVLPNKSKGLDDAKESIIMKIPWNVSEGVKGLMSNGLLRLASGIAREDIEDTLEGLRTIQEGTGLYFSKIQGGVFRNDLTKIASEAWRSRMILAQSSWGPILYTISREDEAEGDADLLKFILNELKIKGEVFISNPRNKGYEIVKS
ncbi:MAG: hypothetical protein C0201_04895 [Caldisphaera sp.]|nr:MAG: hypothetical protein C0201_04895 [Caldisphaera sp.]